MRLLRIALALAILVIVVAGGFVLWAQRAEIAAIEPPARAAFDRAFVEKGAQLAAIGNCDVCHTVPGRSAAERRVEPRRLSGRGARPLRRLPHPAQPSRCREKQPAARRWRG